jgi:two-component system sensor histidine kinase DesK
MNRILSTLKHIDAKLLPNKTVGRISPYVWLIYLPIYFVPVALLYSNISQLLWASLGCAVFLYLYFSSCRAGHQRLIVNLVLILLLGTASSFISPTANVFFVYAAAFCCRLGDIKHGFMGLGGILLWLFVSVVALDLEPYFYLPAAVFSLIVGMLNIYQKALDGNKEALVLSRLETQRLAKIAERERIARDLHDLIGHTFSLITLKADLAGRLIDKNTDKAKQEVKHIEIISREALSQVREVVSGYRSSDLLTELAHAKNVFASLDIGFEYHFENVDESELELDLSANKELAIVLRELVTNIVKHAKATKVTATIKRGENELVLAMQDNGQGFKRPSHEDSTYEEHAHKGFGLKGIEERIGKLRGFVKITSNAENTGTLSEITLPTLVKD